MRPQIYLLFLASDSSTSLLRFKSKGTGRVEAPLRVGTFSAEVLTMLFLRKSFKPGSSTGKNDPRKVLDERDGFDWVDPLNSISSAGDGCITVSISIGCGASVDWIALSLRPASARSSSVKPQEERGRCTCKRYGRQASVLRPSHITRSPYSIIQYDIKNP